MKLMALFWLVFILVIGGCSATYQHATGGSMVATVTDKERVCEGGKDGSCNWMVMTDKMSFKNSDAFFHFKFDSTDLQSSIEVGRDYRIHYYGWRIPFFSIYPNITSIEQP